MFLRQQPAQPPAVQSPSTQLLASKQAGAVVGWGALDPTHSPATQLLPLESARSPKGIADGVRPRGAGSGHRMVGPLQAVRYTDCPCRHVDQGFGDEEGAEPPHLALRLRSAHGSGGQTRRSTVRQQRQLGRAAQCSTLPVTQACAGSQSKAAGASARAGPHQQHPRLCHVGCAAHAGAYCHPSGLPLLWCLRPPARILQGLRGGGRWGGRGDSWSARPPPAEPGWLTVEHTAEQHNPT